MRVAEREIRDHPNINHPFSSRNSTVIRIQLSKTKLHQLHQSFRPARIVRRQPVEQGAQPGGGRLPLSQFSAGRAATPLIEPVWRKWPRTASARNGHRKRAHAFWRSFTHGERVEAARCARRAARGQRAGSAGTASAARNFYPQKMLGPLQAIRIVACIRCRCGSDRQTRAARQSSISFTTVIHQPFA